MSMKVLIVDDAAFIREVLAQLLSKHGFEVAGEAVNGAEAIEMARSIQPDIIVMDIVMPEKSGIQATQEILAEFPQIKIVACSTEGSEAMVTKALEAGCCDFIVKPFKIENVVSTLKSAGGET